MLIRAISSAPGTVALAAASAIAPMVNGIYNNSFNTARLMAVLVLLNLLHIATCPRVLVTREVSLYAAFLGYMILSLSWTPNPFLGFNTIVPAINCLLLLVLFGSMLTFRDLRAVLSGLLLGFLSGAMAFTYVEGFPFVFPKGFSYNAGAAMYLFGLLITLIYGWFSGARTFSLTLAVVILLHIAATTSIKTNLGIVLGVLAMGLFFFRRFSKVLLRLAPLLVLVVAGLVYVVASNEAVVKRVEIGFERVSRGAAVLQSGEDVESATSFDLRSYWAQRGIEGWAASPVFGHGVESFRAENGITSHSTPIDLLYNTGVIGFFLFYGMFLSIAWRILNTADVDDNGLRPLLFAALACYAFITLSGTMFYQTFLAIFIALSVSLLRRFESEQTKPAAALEAALS